MHSDAGTVGEDEVPGNLVRNVVAARGAIEYPHLGDTNPPEAAVITRAAMRSIMVAKETVAGGPTVTSPDRTVVGHFGNDALTRRAAPSEVIEATAKLLPPSRRRGQGSSRGAGRRGKK